MNRRAFTLVELVLVLSVLSLVIPMIYAMSRSLEDRAAQGLHLLEAADAVGTTRAALRLDASRGALTTSGPVGFELPGCTVLYTVDDAGVLVREGARGCAPPQGLARGVLAFERIEGGAELVLLQRLRPGRVLKDRVFLPVEAP